MRLSDGPQERGALPPGLYGIVDLGPGETSAVALDRAKFLCDNGVEAVQLRAKHASLAQTRSLAASLARVVPLLIVNDQAALAAEVGAWAHLGQADGPDPAVAFGRSTHTLSQVRSHGDARYIGFGPVFRTGTKDTGYEPRGLAMLAEAVRESLVPVVAIGGITVHTIEAVRATRVHAWAPISGLWSLRDDGPALRRLLALASPR